MFIKDLCNESKNKKMKGIIIMFAKTHKMNIALKGAFEAIATGIPSLSSEIGSMLKIMP